MWARTISARAAQKCSFSPRQGKISIVQSGWAARRVSTLAGMSCLTWRPTAMNRGRSLTVRAPPAIARVTASSTVGEPISTNASRAPAPCARRVNGSAHAGSRLPCAISTNAVCIDEL